LIVACGVGAGRGGRRGEFEVVGVVVVGRAVMEMMPSLPTATYLSVQPSDALMSVVSRTPLSFISTAWTDRRTQVMVSPIMISVGSGYDIFTPGAGCSRARKYITPGFWQKMAISRLLALF